MTPIPQNPSLQQLFNHVRDHLLTQKAVSTRIDMALAATACAYRGKDGLMCAAGCLIADRHYKSDMEGCSLLYNPAARGAIAASIGCALTDEMDEMLNLLQSVHDAATVEQWPKELERVALSFNLIY